MTNTVRTRSRTPIVEVSDWVYKGFGHTTAGSCTTPPGPCTRYISAFSGAGSLVTLEQSDVMTDVVTQDFEKLRAEGKIINNPMSKAFIRIERQPVSFDWHYYFDRWGCSPARHYEWGDYKSTGTKAVSSMIEEFIPTASFSDKIENEIDKAVSKSFAIIGNEQLLFLGMLKEMSATVAGLTYIVRKAYRIYKAVRKAKLRQLKKELSLSELEDIYMNARYNLRPLYYDAKGLINVLTYEDMPGRQTFRASSIYEDSVNDTVDSYIHIDPYVKFGITFHRSLKIKSKVRAGVLTQAQQTNLSQLLGLDKIIETAWDLLPFSFIIDWFVNVGDTLCAWTPKVGFHVLTSWVTVDTTVTKATSAKGSLYEYFDKNGYFHRFAPTYSFSGGKCNFLSRTFERIPNRERPLLPSLDVNLDLLKLLDLAIITKKLRKTRTLPYMANM